MDKLMMDELIGSLQAHEQKIMKRNRDKARSMSYNQNYPSNKININKRGLQQMDIPFNKEVNKDNKDFNDLKKKYLGI